MTRLAVGSAALVTIGFVYVGAAEITGSALGGLAVAAVATVAEVWLVRTVKRLMEQDAAAAAAVTAAET